MSQVSVGTKTSLKEYRAFHDAKNRCSNPKHPRYSDWGGRGIQVMFSSFEEFYNHIGPRPDGMSLDRINNDDHYRVGLSLIHI